MGHIATHTVATRATADVTGVGYRIRAPDATMAPDARPRPTHWPRVGQPIRCPRMNRGHTVDERRPGDVVDAHEPEVAVFAIEATARGLVDVLEPMITHHPRRRVQALRVRRERSRPRGLIGERGEDRRVAVGDPGIRGAE